MIKIEHTETYGWDAAMRGARNPMNSWDRSDSKREDLGNGIVSVTMGNADLDLMKRLAKAGTDHRKFARMITVNMDITAPLYWWKEYDTYKVGTVANSCSTMHKIHAKEFVLEDFSHEHLDIRALEHLEETIELLNSYRDWYINYDGPKLEIANCPDKKDIWWQMIQLLPSSYNQKRTVQMNYEVLANMYFARKDHKLDEWHDFCHRVEELPFFMDIFKEAN